MNNLLIGSFNSEALVRLTADGKNINSKRTYLASAAYSGCIQAPDGSVLLLTDYKDGELLPSITG